MMNFFAGRCALDERQLLQRGNVFQHVVIVLMALLIGNGFLKDCGITWAEGMWENILIFWAGAGVGMVEFILRDITPAGSRQNLLYIFEGVCGTVLLVLGGTHVLVQGQPLVRDGILTALAAELLSAAAMVAIFLVFFVKRIHDRRGTDED